MSDATLKPHPVPSGRLPGARFEQCEDRKTGEKGEIRLDKGKLLFIGVARGECVESKDGDAVREWVTKRLAAIDDMKWSPVIEVSYSAPYRDGHSWRGDAAEKPWEDQHDTKVELKVEAERYYVGKSSAGHWRKLEWDDFGKANAPMSSPRSSFTSKGLEGLPITDRETRYGSTERTIVAYSEEIWTGISALVDFLKNGRQQVLELMRRDASFEAFASLGADRLSRLLAPSSSEVAS